MESGGERKKKVAYDATDLTHSSTIPIGRTRKGEKKKEKAMVVNGKVYVGTKKGKKKKPALLPRAVCLLELSPERGKKRKGAAFMFLHPWPGPGTKEKKGGEGKGGKKGGLPMVLAQFISWRKRGREKGKRKPLLAPQCPLRRSIPRIYKKRRKRGESISYSIDFRELFHRKLG